MFCPLIIFITIISQPGQTKDLKTGTHCLYAKHSAIWEGVRVSEPGIGVAPTPTYEYQRMKREPLGRPRLQSTNLLIYQ